MKLSQIGVPGLLLDIVNGFLNDRSMVVRYRGETSNRKQLPGGGPQGTLLGLLLFLVLINSCCNFERNLSVGNQITQPSKKFIPSTFCAKYVDEVSIAGSFNIKQTLVEDHSLVRPIGFPAIHCVTYLSLYIFEV